MLCSLDLDSSKFREPGDSILKHGTFNRGWEVVSSWEDLFILSDFILPIEDETMGVAFPCTITKLGRGDVGQQVGCFHGRHSRAFGICSKVTVDSLSVKGGAIVPDQGLSFIGE